MLLFFYKFLNLNPGIIPKKGVLSINLGLVPGI